MRASNLRARRSPGAEKKLSRSNLKLGPVAGEFLSAIVDNKAREICVYGPRGEAKTQTLLLAAVAHAEQSQQRGFPTPVKWIGVTDTHRAHVVKTIPSLFDPLWHGGWKVYDGDHLAVFTIGETPLVAMELFGVEDQGAIDRLRMETVGVWFEEPVAVAVLDQKGISETAWMTAISSQRLPAYSHPAVITTNYPDEDHWTVARFHPPMTPPPYIFQDGERMAIRIPKGDSSSSRSATAYRKNKTQQEVFMFESLAGKKTYIVAAATVVYALLGYYTGNLDFNQAVNAALNGAGLAALRAGVARKAAE